ncbi:hypothetical protein MN608_08692 [Microdochium nivale]|nr:hypothetical protein MN608_08692 [Microdochium nivale]
MAAPAPAATPSTATNGPTLSNVSMSDLEIAARDVTLAAREDTVKIQYYANYIGTHSANTVSWSKDTKGQLTCYYYTAKD